MSFSTQALDTLKATGNEDAAWALAQLDSGLLPHVTRAVWLDWARATLARNAATERAYRR